MRQLSAIVTLTRPLSNAKNTVFIFFIFVVARGAIRWDDAALLFLAISFVSSGMYAYNAAGDRFVDERNENKVQYARAVEAFGEGRTKTLALALFLIGIGCALAVNFWAGLLATFLVLVGYLYSSPCFRFKEKPLLDIVFGAFFTHALRLAIVWTGLLASAPPLVPIMFFSSAKGGGYMLYKEIDRAALAAKGIRNTTTLLPRPIVLALAAGCFLLAGVSFVGMATGGPENRWGLHLLPENMLFLLPLAAPPLLILFLRASGAVRWKSATLRTIGLGSLLIAIFIFFAIRW